LDKSGKKMTEDDYAWEEEDEYVKESLPDETREKGR
jgi:hypothetical protein